MDVRVLVVGTSYLISFEKQYPYPLFEVRANDVENLKSWDFDALKKNAVQVESPQLHSVSSRKTQILRVDGLPLGTYTFAVRFVNQVDKTSTKWCFSDKVEVKDSFSANRTLMVQPYKNSIKVMFTPPAQQMECTYFSIEVRTQDNYPMFVDPKTHTLQDTKTLLDASDHATRFPIEQAGKFIVIDNFDKHAVYAFRATTQTHMDQPVRFCCANHVPPTATTPKLEWMQDGRVLIHFSVPPYWDYQPNDKVHVSINNSQSYEIPISSCSPGNVFYMKKAEMCVIDPVYPISAKIWFENAFGKSTSSNTSNGLTKQTKIKVEETKVEVEETKIKVEENTAKRIKVE